MRGAEPNELTTGDLVRKAQVLLEEAGELLRESQSWVAHSRRILAVDLMDDTPPPSAPVPT